MTRYVFAGCWRLLVSAVLGVVFAAGVTADEKEEDKDKPKEVICQKYQFLVNGKEQALTIRVGESVVWVNKDKVEHTATSDEGSNVKFDEKIPKEGKSKPVKFTKAGTFKYHCKPHEDMVGSIVVKE